MSTSNTYYLRVDPFLPLKDKTLDVGLSRKISFCDPISRLTIDISFDFSWGIDDFYQKNQIIKAFDRPLKRYFLDSITLLNTAERVIFPPVADYKIIDPSQTFSYNGLTVTVIFRNLVSLYSFEVLVGSSCLLCSLSGFLLLPVTFFPPAFNALDYSFLFDYFIDIKRLLLYILEALTLLSGYVDNNSLTVSCVSSSIHHISNSFAGVLEASPYFFTSGGVFNHAVFKVSPACILNLDVVFSTFNNGDIVSYGLYGLWEVIGSFLSMISEDTYEVFYKLRQPLSSGSGYEYRYNVVLHSFLKLYSPANSSPEISDL